MADQYYLLSSSSETCPVCNGQRKDCRKDRLSGAYLCRELSQNVHGYAYARTNGVGFHVYLPGDLSDDQRSAIAAQVKQLAKKAREQIQTSPTNGERATQYQAIASGCPLVEKHREQLRARGLSDSQIDLLTQSSVVWSWVPGVVVEGVSVDLPGVHTDGSLKSYPGNNLTISALSVSKRILGAQVRRDDGYRWISSKMSGGHGPKLRCGEDPIGFYHLKGGLHPSLDNQINITEGLLKPAICSVRYGGPWLGAVGRLFASSRKQIVSVIKKHPDHRLVLNPDAGAVRDIHTIREYIKLQLLCQGQGVDLSVRWWAQVDKPLGDPDEIKTPTFRAATLLRWFEFIHLCKLSILESDRDDLKDLLKDSYHPKPRVKVDKPTVRSAPNAETQPVLTARRAS